MSQQANSRPISGLAINWLLSSPLGAAKKAVMVPGMLKGTSNRLAIQLRPAGGLSVQGLWQHRHVWAVGWLCRHG